MTELFDALAAFVAAAGSLFYVVGELLLPLLPLLAWITFWYLAVDWLRLGPILRRGGWLPVVVITAGIVLVVANVRGEAGTEQVGPLTVSPLAAAIGWALILLSTMFYAGAAQLSRGGFFGPIRTATNIR